MAARILLHLLFWFLQCLNVLVAAGAASAADAAGAVGADNKQLSSYKACALPNCINANSARSPFFLHTPERERRVSHERRGSLPSTAGSISSSRTGPADGLYVNPMQKTTSTIVTHHNSSGEESSDADTAHSGGWFLHNNNPGAPAALYQRVRDLFHTRSPGPRGPAEGQEAPTVTEVAAIHEHSDSDSGAEATRRDHHYEDIYIAKDEHQRRR
ncbi:putative forked protein [Operophtera brumata]|uniref:Putative forked protein n=1 Tax=Operophtera brumata TaxID=104452 RepID=A0A0L7L811_OPEBR|nr:putative forked protein [Operophtera brumata]